MHLTSSSAFRVAVLAAAALVALAYANSLGNDFHFDDAHVIENNLYIRSLGNTPRFFADAATFSSLPQNATYRPLLTLTYAIDYAIGGLDPLQFHITQLICLLALLALLLPLFRALMDGSVPRDGNRWTALFAVTWFGVHTANSETMNFISSRSDILSTLGVAGSLSLYVFAPKARRYFLYLLPMVLGMLVKAPAAVFAAILFLYVYLFESGDGGPARARLRRALMASLPAFVVAVAMLVFLSRMNLPQWTSGGGSRGHYLLTQAFVIAHYIRLFFLPIGLTADTDMQLIVHWYDTRVIAGIAVIALLVLVLVRWSRRPETRASAFGLGWFFLALLPTSSFFPLAEVANEHRIFFPYIGLSLAVVWQAQLFVDRWLSRAQDDIDRRRRLEWVVVIAAAILVGNAAGTYSRNRVWKSEETLWRDVTVKSPMNGRGLMNYGLTQMAAGRYDIARAHFERALAFNPNYSVLEVNLGIVNAAQGRQKEAERHFQRALELNPDVDSHVFYARWLMQQGRATTALPLLEQAIRMSPAAPHPRALLMSNYAAAGRTADLERVARDTLRVDPDNPDARAYLAGRPPATPAAGGYDGWFRLGMTYLNQQRYADAALAFRTALREKPASAEALNNYGWALAKLGYLAPAISAFEEALRVQPDFPLARNNLDWARSVK